MSAPRPRGRQNRRRGDYERDYQVSKSSRGVSLKIVKNYINGCWIDAETGSMLDVENPSTCELNARLRRLLISLRKKK